MLHRISLWLRHFFHVVSNVRPIVWIMLYLLLMPVFACIYKAMPVDQFRIPEGGATDFGSWLYYSIVTLTTLGFGDYTPAQNMAQMVTAIEVMCGLVILGLFLNAVGSMKSEIDVESEIEKQRRLNEAMQRDKLVAMIPASLSVINRFLDSCRKGQSSQSDASTRALLHSAARVSICLDTIQNRVDLSQWPQLLEACFAFVADYQLYSTSEPSDEKKDISAFIDNASSLALTIETELTAISAQK